MADYYSWTVTGVITGLKSWSEPDFGDRADAATRRAPIHIASRMIERQTFLIRQRDGREIEVSLVDSGLALRNGNFVTAVWVARKGVKHGFCVLVNDHTAGTLIRLPQNVKKIRPKVGLVRTAKFGLFATIPALLALLMWLLVPGSLDTVNIGVFMMFSFVALIVLFGIGLIVSKVVLDYLQADDHQKIWKTAEEAANAVRMSLRQTSPQQTSQH